jgi:carbonic anhydrase
MNHIHHPGCGCAARLSRRGLFGLGFAGAVTAAFPALAQYAQYEAMLVNCIDPRVTTASWAYMGAHGYKDLYSQFVIAGGPIGCVAPVFADWHKAFWDNLAITVQLHKIKRVVGLTHRDCGAAFVAYGDALRTDKALETAKQTEALHQFRAGIGQRHPTLAVDTGIMDLNGAVEVVA